MDFGESQELDTLSDVKSVENEQHVDEDVSATTRHISSKPINIIEEPSLDALNCMKVYPMTRSSSVYLSSKSTSELSKVSKSLRSVCAPHSWQDNDESDMYLLTTPTASIKTESLCSTSLSEQMTKNISCFCYTKPECVITKLPYKTHEEISLVPSCKDKTLLSSPEVHIQDLSEIMQLPVIKKIYQKISFNENLLVFTNMNRVIKNQTGIKGLKPNEYLCNTSQEMGGYYINIERTLCKFITYCKGQFALGESIGGSSFLSIIDHSFNIIEENKTETLYMRSGKIEKSLHIFRENSKFIGFRTNKLFENKKKYRSEIKVHSSGGFLLDGGFFVLMRFLAITKFSGKFSLWTMDIDGEMCKCDLSIGRDEILVLNKTPVNTIRIKKTLYCHGRVPDISITNILPTGHIVRHVWKGCQYFLHMDPLTKIPIKVFPRLENRWKSDIILVSKYLDKKEDMLSENHTYLWDNVHVQTFLKDYLLCLLHTKPQNVLDFSIDFFHNICKEY